MVIYEELTLIKDDFGNNIIYDAVFSDIIDLEGELVWIGSHYVLKNESSKGHSIDWIGVVEDLLEHESKYTFAKLKVVEALMECYESITDVVEQQWIIQIITDYSAKRPWLNLKSNYFRQTYLMEIQILEEFEKFLRWIINF